MAIYDPSKRYTWTPEDKFEFNGAEFGLILNVFRSILSTEEAARILLVSEGNQAIERALSSAVENDIVKEAEPPSKKEGL